MNVKNLVLGIGIVIVFGLVLWQGIEAFYPSPEYSDFCHPEKFDYTQNYTAQTCEAAGGMWNPYNYKPGASAPDGNTGYCDLNYYCNKDYEAAQSAHSWTVFLICLVVAVIAFIVGYTILSVEPVGSALMASGVWAVFWGSVVNWRNLGSIWRFLLLAITLVVLIWIALRLNRKNDKKR